MDESTPYPMESHVRRAFADPQEPASPTGVDRSLYLDFAETIVRDAVQWQDAEGRIIDPALGEPWAHSSPRFGASVAPLVRQGRCDDLIDACVRNVDVAIRDLAEGRGRAFDFVPRDVCLAVECLDGAVSDAVMTEWKRLLASVDPVERYGYTIDKKTVEELHNICFYNITGEQMRRALGAGGDPEHMEAHLPFQIRRFTPFGMYRDPACPMTYDLAVRQNLVLMQRAGYDGPHAGFLDEMFRRGVRTQLFYQSTNGEMPFGGRSNQFHHTEAMFCVAAEFEAARLAKAGDMTSAGVFKRAARRAAASTRRWILDARPFRHLKNMFPQESLHGCDPYGYVTGYCLLASNLFAEAALVSDETIPERAAPCDNGGYVMPVLDDFHRVFAACGPFCVQIDTRGQAGHDATGLGRFHHRDCPSELALSCPIASEPAYRTSEPAAPMSFAIGPCWGDEDLERRTLAALEPDGASCDVDAESPDRVAFRIAYNAERHPVEHYELTPDELRVRYKIDRGPLVVSVPLLVTDGGAETRIERTAHGFRVERDGAVFEVDAGTDVSVNRLGLRIPNRNGMYDIAVFESAGREIETRLVLYPEL